METGPAGAGWLLSGFGASLSLILLLLAPRPEYDQGAPRYDFSLHNATYRPGLAMVRVTHHTYRQCFLLVSKLGLAVQL